MIRSNRPPDEMCCILLFFNQFYPFLGVKRQNGDRSDAFLSHFTTITMVALDSSAKMRLFRRPRNAEIYQLSQFEQVVLRINSSENINFLGIRANELSGDPDPFLASSANGDRDKGVLLQVRDFAKQFPERLEALVAEPALEDALLDADAEMLAAFGDAPEALGIANVIGDDAEHKKGEAGGERREVESRSSREGKEDGKGIGLEGVEVDADGAAQFAAKRRGLSVGAGERARHLLLPGGKEGAAAVRIEMDAAIIEALEVIGRPENAEGRKFDDEPVARRAKRLHEVERQGRRAGAVRMEMSDGRVEAVRSDGSLHFAKQQRIGEGQERVRGVARRAAVAPGERHRRRKRTA